MEDCAFRLFGIEKDLKYPAPTFGETYDVADFLWFRCKISSSYLTILTQTLRPSALLV